MLGNKVTTNLLLCTGIQQRTTENLFVESTRKAREGTAQGGRCTAEHKELASQGGQRQLL